MKEETETKIGIGLFVIFVFALGFSIAMLVDSKTDGPPSPDLSTDVVKESGAVLPSIFNIQRQLVELGYEIKVDGKIGPETLTAWDEAICRQEGERSMK